MASSSCSEAVSEWLSLPVVDSEEVVSELSGVTDTLSSSTISWPYNSTTFFVTIMFY